MDTTRLVAGIDALHPLFNPEKWGAMRPREIVELLQRQMGFLVSCSKLALVFMLNISQVTIGDIACKSPMLEVSPFIFNVLFTCEGIVGLLPLASHLPKFRAWELSLDEYTRVSIP